MEHMRVTVPDPVFWWLVTEGARNKSGAAEHAALLLTRAYEATQPDDAPTNGDEQPAA